MIPEHNPNADGEYVGQLRVWWIPQVPMQPFFVHVPDVEQGVRILHALAQYDLFQFDNNVKPDYCNAGGLMMWDGDEWVDWEDEGLGVDDPEEYLQHLAELGLFP